MNSENKKQKLAAYKAFGIPTFAHRRVADSDVQHEIARLIDYLLADEFNHFAGEPDHIWHSVKAVRDWLGWPAKLADQDAIEAALKKQYSLAPELPLGTEHHSVAREGDVH
jgi:hypothetical protein